MPTFLLLSFMLARFQKLFLLSLALYVAVCLAWLWPHAPQVATAAALLPAAFFVATMGFEFAAMQRLNRGDPGVALASRSAVLRAWARELGVALRVFCWRQPFFSRSEPDWLPAQPSGARGVVLVHGLMCNRAVWQPWFARLRALGHAHVAVNLEPVIGSIDDYAEAIDAAVRRVTAATGLPPVLVCHSMGGLAARAWLRAMGSDARVHRVLTLGSPHAGTWLARFSHTPNGRQMQLNSPWLQALAAQEPAARARLFVCWYSDCDNIVFPASTAALPGAQQRPLQGIAHLEMALHPDVVQACLEEIAKA